MQTIVRPTHFERNVIKTQRLANHFKIKELLRKEPGCRKPMDEFVLPAPAVKELVVKLPFGKVSELSHVSIFYIYFNLPGSCNFVLNRNDTQKKIKITI